MTTCHSWHITSIYLQLMLPKYDANFQISSSFHLSEMCCDWILSTLARGVRAIMHNSFSLKGAALQGEGAVVKSYAFGHTLQNGEHWSDLWTLVLFVNISLICENWSDLQTLFRFVIFIVWSKKQIYHEMIMCWMYLDDDMFDQSK